MKHLSKRLPACVAALLLLATSDLLLGADRTIVTVASTVPANGDVNPYGVAIVPNSVGNLHAGHILVSNFNNSANLQGTGTTIMDIAPNGTVTTFAQISASNLPVPCPGGIGLTTALVALRAGWVVVGSLPTMDGTAATAQAGCLLVLNSRGTVAGTIVDASINGPWDMTALDLGGTGSLFVTNVLNGTVAAGGSVVNHGSVIRIDFTGASPTTAPMVLGITTIASAFPERTDPAALVIGPTGVGLGSDGTLYVADSLDNRIAGIVNAITRTSDAGNGRTVSQGGALNDPLGLMVIGKNIATVNGNNGLLVSLMTNGTQTGKRFLDVSGMPPGAGALFGLAQDSAGLYFVDDATNTLNLLTSSSQ